MNLNEGDQPVGTSNHDDRVCTARSVAERFCFFVVTTPDFKSEIQRKISMVSRRGSRSVCAGTGCGPALRDDSFISIAQEAWCVAS